MDGSVAGQDSAMGAPPLPLVPGEQIGTISCLAGTNQCEFQNLSASQIGTVIAALVGFAVLLSQWLHRHHGEPLVMQYWLLFSLTTFYYLINELAIEETKVSQLRSLKYGLRHVEFWIRVLIVVFLAFAAKPLLDNDAKSDVEHSLQILIGIYAFFLLWDVLVVIGGQRRALEKMWIADLLGCGCAAASLWFRNTDEEGFIIVAMAVILGIFSWNSLLTAKNRLAAIKHRSRLR